MTRVRVWLSARLSSVSPSDPPGANAATTSAPCVRVSKLFVKKRKFFKFFALVMPSEISCSASASVSAKTLLSASRSETPTRK